MRKIYPDKKKSDPKQVHMPSDVNQIEDVGLTAIFRQSVTGI